MICIALAGTALLGVGWRVGFSSLIFPVVTGTVGFCPVGVFIIVATFVKFLRNFHAFEYFLCFLVGPSL